MSLAMPKKELFEYVRTPRLQLSDPSAILSAADFELLSLTVEDFSFVTRSVTHDLNEVAADIRSRSTMLRRLLSESDLYKIGRLLAPKEELRVRARMIDFEPAHPAFIVTCGDNPWADDRLPGMALQFSIKDVADIEDCPWTYRENADVSLSEYLDGLAVSVLGTRIKRRQLIKYVADKKAAHVSEKRKHAFEEALDRAWYGMSMTIIDSEGEVVRLNHVYMELLSVIEALQRSPSINGYIDDVRKWIGTAIFKFDDDVTPTGLTLPIEPM
jgi:hypothetical protein